ISMRETIRLLLRQSRGFWLVNMVNFGDGIAYFGILNLLTRFLGTDLGMTDHVTSLSVSAFTGLVTLTMFGGGFVSDFLGVRRAITLSLVLLLIGRIILPESRALGDMREEAAWLSLFFMAIGSGILQPALYAGTKEYTDARTNTIAYSLLYAIMNLGIAAEAFVSPWIRTGEVIVRIGGLEIHGLNQGIGGVFWFCAIITALMLVVHLLTFTRRVEQTERLVEEAPPEDPKTMRERLAELPFLDVRFMYFIFILLPVRTLFAHQWMTVPDYVFRSFPTEVNARFEWLMMINPLIVAVGVPVVAALTRHARVVDMMIAGTAVSAISTFLLVPSPDVSMLITYMIVFSIGEALWGSRFFEYVADLAPPGKVGAYMGLAGIPWFLAKTTTGMYSGLMLERYIPKTGVQDPGTLWLIYAVFSCITPIGLILARRWILAQQQRAGE
ncbi:MAG: MFS transporter, partial [Armatimonadetes bacterium]|nr:MFS transporter [Armatimonadota bacterium]